MSAATPVQAATVRTLNSNPHVIPVRRNSEGIGGRPFSAVPAPDAHTAFPPDSTVIEEVATNKVYFHTFGIKLPQKRGVKA
jgi:hypothetical protein